MKNPKPKPSPVQAPDPAPPPAVVAHAHPAHPVNWPRFILTLVFLIGGFYLVIRGSGEAIKIGGGVIVIVGGVVSVAWGVVIVPPSLRPKGPGGGGAALLLGALLAGLTLPSCCLFGQGADYIDRAAIAPSVEAIVERHDVYLTGDLTMDPVARQVFLQESALLLDIVRSTETVQPPAVAVPPAEE